MIGLPSQVLAAQDAVEVRWTLIKRALSAGKSTAPALKQGERHIDALIAEARTLQSDMRRTRVAEERAERARCREHDSAERNNARILAARSVS